MQRTAHCKKHVPISWSARINFLTAIQFCSHCAPLWHFELKFPCNIFGFPNQRNIFGHFSGKSFDHFFHLLITNLLHGHLKGKAFRSINGTDIYFQVFAFKILSLVIFDPITQSTQFPVPENNPSSVVDGYWLDFKSSNLTITQLWCTVR